MLKKILSAHNSHPFYSDIVYAGVRVFVGVTMAVAHGLGKMPPPEMMIEKLNSMGFPAAVFFAWCAALAEVVGGVLLAIGLLTRPAALFIGFTMLIAGFVIHASDPFQHKELALMYLAVSLLFAIKGAGRYSVDAVISKRF